MLRLYFGCVPHDTNGSFYQLPGPLSGLRGPDASGGDDVVDGCHRLDVRVRLRTAGLCCLPAERTCAKLSRSIAHREIVGALTPVTEVGPGGVGLAGSGFARNGTDSTIEWVGTRRQLRRL